MKNNLKIDQRFFKVKSPTLEFYCPLCRTKRSMSYHSRLSKINFFQIISISIIMTLILYPIMQLRGAFIIFLVWGIFEACVRTLFKKNIPCPHCGFDATLYKKDVRIAKESVKNFWTEKNMSNPSKTDLQPVKNEQSENISENFQ